MRNVEPIKPIERQDLMSDSILSLLVGACTVGLGLLVYASGNFPTRVEHERLEHRVDTIEGSFHHDLERIENKIDHINQRLENGKD